MQHLPSTHPFRKHSQNLRAVASGLKQAERLHKDAIRRNDLPGTSFAARMHQMMVGLLAEAHLRKAIADPDGFNDRERELLRASRSQLERWSYAVELAFRRHYSVPLHLTVDEQLGPPTSEQFLQVQEMLEQDLRVVIEDRNKIAHAQWEWLLNSKEKAFIGPADVPLNYVQTSSRSQAIDLLARLVHVLVVSEPTFQRDYARIMADIKSARQRFAGAEYEEFAATLRSRNRPGT